jgi:hypothetical protein
MWKADDPRADERQVYFLAAEGSSLIKIGVANCAYARIKALGKTSPVPLTLLGCIATDRTGSLEKDLHARFSAHRSHGEWFRAEPEILSFIAEHTTLPRPPRFGPGGRRLKPGEARPVNRTAFVRL